jgi:hypothetical protein
MVASSAMAAGFTFLSGAYYNGYFFGDPFHFILNTEAFSRLDSFIAFTDGSTSPPVVNWNFTGTPLDGVTDRFSVRWKGLLQVDTAGTYSFKTVSDDGIIVYLDDAVVISNPTEHAPTTNEASLSLSAGSYPFELLYGENGGGSVALLQWKKPGDSSFSTILSQPVVPTPGPLPLLGLAAAFKTSRNVRRRLRSRLG